MDVFSLVGKITINYAEAEKGLEKISDSAEDAAKSLDEVDDKADEAGNSAENAGKSAKNADSGFSVWKATLANLASQAITAVIQKCEQLAGKMVELTQTAVGNYADYEQLVGGVETLFGNSADQLIGYAENAYKTVQLSSNDYMETATSFAASLIQGLGGDTEAAVRLTDLAITDMADNANKMGTDISSIQDAYQGFAKQNYTMLDNLKLGYGGTQSEMIRLINDSGILNETIDSLDDITFDQMIEAIHEIQDEMGITNTSAEEAGTTISGSWNSVRAMFDNILTKVGGQLRPTIMKFLNELQNWMNSVDWDAFAEEVGNAFEGLFDMINEIDFTSFFQAGIEGVGSFLTTLGNLIAKIPEVVSWFEKWWPVIKAVVTALGTMIVITSVISMITSLVGAISALANPIGLIIVAITAVVAAITYLWNTNETFRNAVIAIWEGIKTAISAAIEAIKPILEGLAQVFSAVWQAIVTVVQMYIAIYSAIITTVFTAVQTFIQTALTVLQTIFTTVWSAIQTVVTTIVSAIQMFITTAWTTIQTVVSTVVTTIQTVITTVWTAIQTVVSTVMNTISSVISTVWNAISTTVSTVVNTIRTTITTVWNGIKSTITTVVNSIKSTISSVFNSVKSTISSIMNSIKSTFSNVWNGIKSTVSSVINGIKSTISSGMNSAKSSVTGVLNSIKSTFSNIWNSCSSVVSGAISKIKSIMNFSWSLPHLSLPHISISGHFSINPPSVPHFGISWYKKAMEDGMIMNSPTIFGFNPKSNQFMAGGEAGSETVVGTGSLMEMITAAVAKQNDNISAYVAEMADLMQQYLPGMANMQMVTDTGALIGEISSGVTKEVKAQIGHEYKNKKIGKGNW